MSAPRVVCFAVVVLSLVAIATSVWASGGYPEESGLVLTRASVISGMTAVAALTGGLFVRVRGRRRRYQRPAPPQQPLETPTAVRTRERLKDLEASNNATLRAIPDLMFVLDRDGTYLDYHARDESQLFAPPDGFLGKNVRDVMPPDMSSIFVDAIQRACAGTDPVVVEYELPMTPVRYYEARLVSVDATRVLSIVRDRTEMRRALQQNQELAGRLIASQELERARIARELHDGVCQEITALSLDLASLRRSDASNESDDLFRTATERLTALGETLRRLSHGLHPLLLQQMGLVDGLESQCAEIARLHHFEVSFSSSGTLEPVNNSVALALFRIVQEALLNAARHGDARHADVSLVRGDHDVALRIGDDGAGFDPHTRRRSGGLGLLSIEERARVIQGTATITSRPGAGTSVVIRVPLTAYDQPFADENP